MNGKGERTLRSYSEPMNLSELFGASWAARRGNVFHIAERLDDLKHYRLVERDNIKVSRPADSFMLKTTVAQREWPEPANFSADAQARHANC